MSGYRMICEEIPQRCSDCGTIAETRPYGANHQEICFACGQKDPAMTEIRMKQLIFGDLDNGS